MKNKRIIITIIAILVLLVSAIGFSYAFFEAQSSAPVITNLRAITHTVDTLTLSIDENIQIIANQLNFTNGGDNQDGESLASAILTPNSKTGEATKHYYLYLNLTSNDTVYSRANTNHDPELLLQVFDSSDNLVTLTGLGTQKTINGLTGYDITGVEGLKTLLNNHEISASNYLTTTEEWRVVITFINLDVNQNDNTDKHIRATLIIRENEMEYCEAYSNEGICGIASLASNTTTLTNGYLYRHDSTLENGANDGSYRYAGPNPNNYVCFGSEMTPCPDQNIYRIIGLVPVNVVTNNQTNPVTTENQTLYKIIKYDYLTSSEVSNGTGSYNSNWHPSTYNGPSGSQFLGNPQGYYWSGSNSNSSNTWSRSTLNTNGLNGSYLTGLGSIWSNKIATVIWKVGGGDSSYLYNASPMSTVYRNEIIESGMHVTYATDDGKNEYAAKVGLMYISDYGYAAPSDAWNTIPNSYKNSTISSNNWMFRGIYEWLLSRLPNYRDNSASIFHSGAVTNDCVYWRAFAIRPTFYLTQDTIIDMTNHAGTLADPYRIS